MPNLIKYSTTGDTLSLKKGNFYIGVGDVGKGPTEVTGYWNGVDVPSGGYIIHKNKSVNGPAMWLCKDDAEFVYITNNIEGTTFTGATESLVYYSPMNDAMVFNRNYETITTDGLELLLDAGFTPSYPRSGFTWYDLSYSGNNGTLVNGPTYSNVSGGTLVFDGIDDYIQIQNTTNLPNWSYSFWYSTTYEPNQISNLFLQLNSTNKFYQNLDSFFGLYSITLDSNNNLYAGTFGNYQYRDGTSFLAQKINNDGTLNSFNFNYTPGSAVAIYTLLVKSDNSVGYIAGTNFSRLSKFDTTTGTILLTNNNINSTLNNTVHFLDEINNHVYMGSAGFTSIGGVPYGRFARFDMDTLVVDSSFDTSVGFDSLPIRSVKNSNNKIYVVGGFTTYKGSPSRGIIRLNYDGSIDPTFNVGSGFNSIGTTLRIILDPNEKPIITGSFTSYNGTTRNRIIRLNTDGSIDNTFNIGVGMDSTVTDSAYDLINQKIYCTGIFTSYSGVPYNRLVRINLDGSIDNSFIVGTGFNGSMDAVAVQTDGKVIVGEGSINVNRTFTRTYNGSQFASFIRLNYDGSIDNTFDAGLGYTQGTYRMSTYIGYKNSLGVPTILSGLGAGSPVGSGRIQISLFQNYYNNRWYQLTISKGDDGVYRLYLNGNSTGTVVPPAGSDSSLEFNRILNRGNQSSVLLYDRGLTATEILQNFNAQKSRFGL